jgi:hypothetical protein
MDTEQIQAMGADIYHAQSKGLDFRSPDDREALEMRGLVLSRRKQVFDSPGRTNEINGSWRKPFA